MIWLLLFTACSECNLHIAMQTSLNPKGRSVFTSLCPQQQRMAGSRAMLGLKGLVLGLTTTILLCNVPSAESTNAQVPSEMKEQLSRTKICSRSIAKQMPISERPILTRAAPHFPSQSVQLKR